MYTLVLSKRGGGECALIFSYISRLQPFVWVLNFEFPLLEVGEGGGGSEKIFFGGEGYGEILDIWGVITKTGPFWGVIYIYIFPKVKVQN